MLTVPYEKSQPPFDVNKIMVKWLGLGQNQMRLRKCFQHLHVCAPCLAGLAGSAARQRHVDTWVGTYCHCTPGSRTFETRYRIGCGGARQNTIHSQLPNNGILKYSCCNIPF